MPTKGWAPSYVLVHEKLVSAARDQCCVQYMVGGSQSPNGIRFSQTTGEISHTVDTVDLYSKSVLECRTANTMSSLTSESHRRRRKRVAHVYSNTWLHTSTHVEGVVSQILSHRLLPLLSSHSSGSRAVEALELCIAVGLDIVSAFFFGLSSSPNFIEDVDHRRSWLTAYLDSHTHETMLWTQEAPTLKSWLGRVGFSVASVKSLEAARALRDWCSLLCSQSCLETSYSGTDSRPTGDKPEVYRYLRRAIEGEQKANVARSDPGDDLEISSEILDHLGK
jgi:hypothetical protein